MNKQQQSIQPKFKSSKDAILLLRSHISSKQIKLPRNSSLEDYIKQIKKLCRRLSHNELDFVIPNAFRRIIQIIRQLSSEEGLMAQQEKPFKELSAQITGIPMIRQNSKSLTEGPASDGIINYYILPAVDQMIDELESYQDDINAYASSHFTSEVIMVYEYSTTVINFLLSAKQVKNFEIIVVESETQELGKQCAEYLSKHQLNVTLIPFTNSFAIMQRVNKILLGVDAILKNGGLLMHPGTYALCVTAKQFSIPIIVLSGAHKLTPKYAFNQGTFNELISPLQINSDSQALQSLTIGITYDYVPPEYISLYITNQGQYTPQSIYQLFNDFYNSKDEDI